MTIARIQIALFVLMMSWMESSGNAALAADSQLESEPIDKIIMDQVDVQAVLSFYSRYSGRELIVAANVDRALKLICVRTNGSFSRSEVADVLAGVLREQAGIFVVPLDSKRASVTYNEALVAGESASVERLAAGNEKNDFLSFASVIAILNLVLAAFIFWIWMILDCARFENEGGAKVGWLLVLIFSGIIAAPLYLFVRKIPRKVVV